MRAIELATIGGIHPDFAKVERELDLASFDLPDPVLDLVAWQRRLVSSIRWLS